MEEIPGALPSPDIDSALALLANHSPRDLIRVCGSIFSFHAELSPGTSKISRAAVERGTMAMCEQLASERYRPDVIKELSRVGKEAFTTNYLASDVFKFHTNSARNKTSNWTKFGAIEMFRTINVESSRRPVNMYRVTDVVLNRLINRQESINDFFRERWLECGNCGHANMISAELIPDGNDLLCAECGSDLVAAAE